jgi:hypothetical protein
MQSTLKRTLAAITEFCNRVDKGEIKSKRTYEKFRAILLEHDQGMSPEDRAAKASAKDPRTSVERFNSLSQTEKHAFIGFFRGASSRIQIAWDANTESIPRIFFGKYECEQVPFSFWKYKLPGLRLTEYGEDCPVVALGMSTGSVVVSAYISVTADGREVYEAWLNNGCKE